MWGLENSLSSYVILSFVGVRIVRALRWLRWLSLNWCRQRKSCIQQKSNKFELNKRFLGVTDRTLSLPRLAALSPNMLFLLGISGFWMDSIPCRCQIGRNTLGETATLATVLWGLRRAMSSKAGLVQLILSEHGWLNRSKLMMTCGSKWFLDLGLNVYSSSTLADALTLVWAMDDCQIMPEQTCLRLPPQPMHLRNSMNL